MAQQIDIEIKLEGREELLTPFRSISIEQRTGDHHRFALRIPMEVLEEKNSISLNKSKDIIGKNITISMKPRTGENKSATEFKGIMTEITYNKYDNSPGDLVIKGHSPTVLLESTSHCQSFTEKNLQQIVNEILKSVPQNLIKSNVHPKFSATIPYKVQYKESNFNFIKRLAAEYGEFFYYDGKELFFGQPSSQKSYNINFRKDINDLNLSLKVKPLGFKNIFYDYIKEEDMNSTSSSQKVEGVDNFGKHLVQQSEKLFSFEAINTETNFAEIGSKSDLDLYTKIKKSSAASDLVLMEGACDTPTVQVGTIANISVSSSIRDNLKEENYGKFLITSVMHISDGVGNYTNKFQGVSSELQITPPPEYYKLMPEPQLAVVKKNNDPYGIGRVRVLFHWQKPPELSPWIRISTPHAGEKRGFYFIPEVNDEVWVGFENNIYEKPYIISSLYTGKRKSEWKDEENNLKGIKTRSGNVIYLNDENGKEEIKIYNNAHENEISMKLKDGEISIKAKKRIYLKAPEIILDAQKIIMNAEKTSEMNAKELIQLKSNKELKVQAMKEISLESMAEMKLESLTSSFKTSAKTEINGGANTTIKAGIVMIN